MTHKIFHAASGALGAGIMGQDMVSGAFGAAVAATLSEQLIAEAPQAIDNLAFDNPSLSNKELMNLYKKSIQGSIDLIKIETAALALVLGQDVAAATEQAINAVENNCLPLLLVIAAGVLIQVGTRYAARSAGKAAAKFIAKKSLKEFVKKKLPDNIKKDRWIPDIKAL